ncbi:MAG TPA: MASE1 domain-containing protein [Woeseiaceae bacterium]|nr:MASE1 domain-containing protein [Woeseiaceae bacterium]
MRYCALIIGLTAAYYVAGRGGLHFFGVLHPSASAVWIPTAIAIAASLLFGYRIWPAIFTGALLVNLTTQGSLLTSLGVATGNTLEGILAAYLVRQFADAATVFARASNIFRFAGVAAAAAAVSATIGVGSLTLGGYAPPADFGAIWFTWWLGDVAGAVVVTPLLVLWSVDRLWAWPARRVIEAACLLGSLVLVGSMTFFHSRLGSYPLAFLSLAPLVWAAFRFGPREAATAVALLSLIATWATATGQGPFHMRTSNESLLVLQGFMTFMAMTALAMAALTSERAALLARERKARTEAEAAGRAKDEFLAILSHELRNPLHAISAAGAVLRGTDSATTAQARRWQEIVHRQTEQLRRLIDDMLDIAKVTVEKMALHRRPMDLAEAVARSLGAQAGGALSRVELQREPAWIHADPDRIAQVIDNLLDNAVKYTPAPGSIRVSVTSEGEFAVLRVEDSGVGIADEFLPHVFDPFLQGRQGLDRPIGGLGIGLTLVRRLTELHGGTVDAYSPGEGQGSAFVVRLPRIDAPLLPAPAPADDVAAGISAKRFFRILIVEDNSDARQALGALLELAGCSVREAEDGAAGIELALRLEFDIVLLDIGLPHLDGYEVARRIKAAKPAIGVIALSGYGREEDKARAADAGFDAYLVKPVDVELLLARMQELCGVRQGLAARKDGSLLSGEWR